jgi:hypothetical protein
MTAALVFISLFIIVGIAIIADDGKWDRKK